MSEKRIQEEYEKLGPIRCVCALLCTFLVSLSLLSRLDVTIGKLYYNIEFGQFLSRV